MSQNCFAIVPLWGFHRSAMGKLLQNERTRPFTTRFESMRATSDRLNEPFPILTLALNGCDLCHWSKLFCNRSDMGISSFCYGEKGGSPVSCPISARFKSMRPQSNSLIEHFRMATSDFTNDDLCQWSKSFCNRSDMGKFSKL